MISSSCVTLLFMLVCCCKFALNTWCLIAYIYSLGNLKLLAIAGCRGSPKAARVPEQAGLCLGSQGPPRSASAHPSLFSFFEELFFSVEGSKCPGVHLFWKEHFGYSVFRFVLLCSAPQIILMSSVELDVSKDWVSPGSAGRMMPCYPLHCLPLGRLCWASQVFCWLLTFLKFVLIFISCPLSLC